MALSLAPREKKKKKKWKRRKEKEKGNMLLCGLEYISANAITINISEVKDDITSLPSEYVAYINSSNIITFN